jgi:PAS domain S-box-containing protein
MTAVTFEQIPRWTMEYGIKPLSIATCFVLVALLWTFPLQHVIAYPFVFLFFGAIMGSAWFGGAVAGFIAVVESSLIITYFFIPPLFSITVAKESQSFLAAFILCAFAISIVSSARKRAENAVRAAKDELETKVRERTADLERSNLDIQESERQLRILTEAIPQQIWRADCSGRIEYCNQHLRDYVGTRNSSITGDSFFKILHTEDEVLFRQGWESALVAGAPFEVKVRVRGGVDGSFRWYLVRSIPQRSEDGMIARWYGIHIDIEEQHRAQQNLLLAQDNLSRLSRTLSMAEMAASIAHELNQPLTAVVTHAYACREWLTTYPANLEKASVTADKIVQESTRASAVVKRVRALFRKEDTERQFIDVNVLVLELSRLLRDEAIRRGVAIRVILDHTLHRIEADPVQIQQVLLNLATNAMDAMVMVASPELTIRSEKYGADEVVISIDDNGPGIAQDVAGRIFEPFFSTKEQGTGMGLAICRSIIEAHDGRIWAENLNPVGVRFRFTLRVKA